MGVGMIFSAIVMILIPQAANIKNEVKAGTNAGGGPGLGVLTHPTLAAFSSRA